MKLLGLVGLAGLLALPAAGQVAATPATAASAEATPANPFPPTNPAFFDTASPTVETVNAFLKAIWGYDGNRTWSVAAIQKTPAPGVSKVVVLVADKTQGSKVQPTQFYVTPDGKHAIADVVFDFGANPFAEKRAVLEQRADGPARGATGKKLLLVEFADLQCPHCKEGQPTVDRLLQDFPQARVVFQNFPLTEIHPYAFKAAAYGTCIAAKSNAAFFDYLKDVFEHQEALNTEAGDQTLANAAVKAGQDAAAMAACAASPATKTKVDAQTKLAQDVGVDQTPMIAVNGHLMPLAGVPYETLKQVVAYEVEHGSPATPAVGKSGKAGGLY